MPDAAHRWTEREIDRLSRRLGRVYKKAFNQAKVRYEAALAEYSRERSAILAAMGDTAEEKAAFDAWCQYQALGIGADKRIAEQLAYDLTVTDAKAREVADGVLPNVYTKNYNYAIGEIAAQVPRVVRRSLTLVDEHTVRKLVTENPRLLPIPETIEEGTSRFAKAVAYNRRQVTTAVTQGVLQGESIPKIAERIGTVYGRSANAATRYARTACTCAENAGRLQSYFTAEEMGIELQKQWIATGDDRTRDTHLEADGQTVPIDEPFTVGDEQMDEPGDPSGGGEAWNCRCTMRAVVSGYRANATSHAFEIAEERARRA